MCSPADDNMFGPGVGGTCRGGFDFTLLFEQSILTLLPAAVFLVAAVARLVCLMRTDEKTKDNPFRAAKSLGAAILLGWQVAILVLTSWDDGHARTRVSIVVAAINVIAAIQFLALSWIEDARAVRPSTVLCTYLVLTAFLDIPQTGTLWLLHRNGDRLAAYFSASVATKALLVVLEAQQKRKYLKDQYQRLPPESTSGIIGHSFLWWVNGLIRRGLYPPPLVVEELYDLDLGLSSMSLGEQLRQKWDQRRRPERRFELVWAVCRVLWWPMVRTVFPRLCLIAINFTQPFLVGGVIGLLFEPEDENTVTKIYFLVAATGLIYAGRAIATLHFQHSQYRSVAMSRGALVSLIYDRALLIQDGVYDDSAAVTLMSSDTDRISYSLEVVHGIWSQTLEVCLGIALLAYKLGWACIMPILVVLVSGYGSSLITRRIGNNQKTWVAALQKRIGTTSSVLADMRSVKMMGLSHLMTETLQKLRSRETDLMEKFRLDIVWQNVVSNFPINMAPPLTFAMYAIQAAMRGNYSSIDTTLAFTSLAVIHLVTIPAYGLLSSIPMTAAGIGSFDRIQKFLLEPLRQDDRLSTSLSPTSSRARSARTLESGETLDEEGANEYNAEGNAAFHSTAISVSNLYVRPAAQAEMALHDVSFHLPQGSITTIIGPVAAGKSTLLKAILGELPYEKGTVTVADNRMAYCAQTPWLPNTSIRKTICGPFDIVDEVWYRSCLRACALDHDIALLPDGDDTKMGSGGINLSGGQKHRVALARALYTRAKIVVLDDMLSALDTTTRKSVVEFLLGDNGLLRKIGSTVVLVSHATECLPYADKILILSKGRLDYDGTHAEAVITGVIDRVLLTLQQDEDKSEESQAPAKKSSDSRASEVENLTRQTGDMTIYKYYWRSIGWRKAGVFLAATLAQITISSFDSFWLKWWSDAKGGQLRLFLTVYLLLPLINSVAIFYAIWTFLVYIAPSSANKLHYMLLNTVMKAPQSFFSATPTGKIVNMFSQDMTLIESSLPIGASVFVSCIFRAVACFGLIATASVYITATVPFLFLGVYVLQYIYLKTSRQMRFLDLEAKSPLYAHCLETLSGLSTIRAFGWQQATRIENNRLLDLSQRPYYLLLSCRRWMVLVLSLMISAQTVMVVALALSLRHTTDPGYLGVSLSAVMGFNEILASLMKGWTDFEVSLGSVARVRKLEKDVLPEDKVDESFEPPSTWPNRGEIVFRNVTASHNPDAVALRDVSITVSPGQKLGLCGRTGSGKSSLVGTILRLLEINSGSILIDGLDLSVIPRNTIRSRLATLPQDPLIIVGTLRLNADPLSVATDEAIIHALTRVGLWTGMLENRPWGLDAEVTASSLSNGQQQLLALARALLKIQKGTTKILLLDEPTSNVDLETDETVQRVLKEDCADCTVVTVAHRMETILESDVIAVMEEGRVVEFGKPQELLSRNGMFAKLVNG